MPPLVLKKIQREPLLEKELFFFSSWKLFRSFPSTGRSTCALPGWRGRRRLVWLESQQPPTASGSPRPTPERQALRCGENRAILRNLPSQLFPGCGLPLSHELLYSKAKLSS